MDPLNKEKRLCVQRLDQLGIYPTRMQTQSAFEVDAHDFLEKIADEKEIEGYREICERFFVRWGCCPYWEKVKLCKPKLFPLVLAQHVQEGSSRNTWIEIPSPSALYWPLNKLYSVEELLHHEWIHSIRSRHRLDHFDEPIAYLSSPYRWRRWCGALLGDSFVQICLLLWAINSILFSMNLDVFLEQNQWWNILFLAISSSLGIVLLYRIWRLRPFFALVKRLESKGLLALLLRLDGYDIEILQSLDEKDWSEYFSQLSGPYGDCVRRAFKEKPPPLI